MRRPVTLALAAAVAVSALGAGGALPALAADGTTVTIPVGHAPGTPAKYDKVFVTKYGPASARKVLVLIPGTNGGAGDFSLLGPELVQRVPGLQVWALDRREQALEDTSVLQQVAAGARTPAEALDYYLGAYLPGAAPAARYTPLQAKDFTFMRNWGMKMNMEDMRRVILKARSGGRTVILGGHSLGGAYAAGYAAWDFAGHPGYKDIAGIVGIDGGLAGSFGPGVRTAAKARSLLKRLDVTPTNPDGPWANVLGLKGFAWVTGPFVAIGSLAALQTPDAPSILQAFPLLPAMLKAPVRTTNAAALGYALDSSTSPAKLAALQVRAGGLAPAGDPRGWQDGEVSPIENVARGFAGGRVDGVDWYFPTRMSIDMAAAAPVADTPAARLLGLRERHLAEVNVPYYAFQTSLTGKTNGVLTGARAFARRSKVPRGRLVLVDGKATNSHLDPLFAAPATNRFLQTVVPFLKRIRLR